MKIKTAPVNAEELARSLTLREQAELCSGADFTHTEPIARVALPTIKMANGSHGVCDTDSGDDTSGESATCFPSESTLACSFDRDLVSRIAGAIGDEAAHRGVSLLFAPSVNIKRSPLGGRNSECFSEDPLLSGELGAAYVNGLLRSGVRACLGKFAISNQENRRFISNSCVDERAMNEIYLEPFRIALQKSKPAAVMTGSNLINGEYVGESTLLRDVLRSRFGFGGVIVSDFGAVNDRVKALKSSLDLEMPGKASGSTGDILKAVRSEELSRQTLGESAQRIVRLAVECAADAKSRVIVDSTHTREARFAAEQSAVLLKNTGLLPLDESKRIAIIGYCADNPVIQAANNSFVSCRKPMSVCEAMDERGIDYRFSPGYNADGTTNDLLVRQAVECARESDAAVVFLALPNGGEFKGLDRTTMALPEGELKLVDRLLLEQTPVAVVLCVDTPVELPFEPRTDAILLMGLAGQEFSHAAVDLLTGKENPCGKLAESWPKKASDAPCSNYYSRNRKNAEYRESIWVGYRYYDAAGVAPMYPFGHGLSYTDFTYSTSISLERTDYDGGRLGVSVNVTNSGSLAGGQIVQLYVGRTDSERKRLSGFEKLFLLPGQTRTAHFELSERDFSVYVPGQGLTLAPGEYYIIAAASSKDLRVVNRINVIAPELPDFPSVSPTDAASLGDAEFSAVLGYLPKEPLHKPYSLNSTLTELHGTLAGRLLIARFEIALASNHSDNFKYTISDIPLRTLSALSAGILPMRNARAAVNSASGKPIPALIQLFSGFKYTKSRYLK